MTAADTLQAPSLTLQEVSDIVRSAALSRAAIETSTPEQIVWMTKQKIEDNLLAAASGEPHNYRWLPQVYGVVADIQREVAASKLSDKQKATVARVIERAASGWPA